MTEDPHAAPPAILSATLSAGEIVATWTPSQSDFDAFAELSGDDNPIHVDPAFSARTRFGRTVSHGMLLYSRLWALLRTRHPGRRHAMQSLMFPNPAYAGEELAFRFSGAEAKGNGGTMAIEIRRIADGKVVLSGECLLEEI
jgi:acyl dehydratase